ncbi:hypothetical protein BDR22DRAFT_821988 [Usnea florida]
MLLFKLVTSLALYPLILPSCVTATNGSCQHLSNITDTNTIRYVIPHSDPPALLFNGQRNPKMNPSVALLAIIENMQPVCRWFAVSFPPNNVSDYRLLRITIQNQYVCGPLTYNDACTALRGLAEFMSLHNEFYQWSFQIFVNGYSLGSGQIEGIQQAQEAASLSLVATS